MTFIREKIEPCENDARRFAALTGYGQQIPHRQDILDGFCAIRRQHLLDSHRFNSSPYAGVPGIIELA